MGCKMEACVECTRNCEIIHRKKKNLSPVVSSFFKIMIGARFSEFLFLPPKFAPAVSGLVDQKIHLEDSCGRQWEVTLSTVDGSFAFHRGWDAFSSDHGLELGDFLLFYYLRSHFMVEIYDRSGCKRVDFPRSRISRKRHRATGNSSNNPVSDKSSMDNQCSSASAVSGASAELHQNHCEPNVVTAGLNKDGLSRHQSKMVSAEELFFITDRRVENNEGAGANPAFDLSDFETMSNKPGAHGSHKIRDANKLVPDGTEISQEPHDAAVVDIDPVLGSFGGRPCKRKGKNIAIEQNGALEDVDNRGILSNNYGNEAPVFVKKEPRNTHEDIYSEDGRPKIVKEELVDVAAGFWNNKRAFSQNSGKEPIVKGGDGRCTDSIMREGKRVKTEAIDAISISLSKATNTSYSVKVMEDSLSVLELPADLPSSFFKGNSTTDRKVLYLEDPSKIPWPVLYREISGLRLLTNGWEAFRKANSIQPGDECIFLLRSLPQSIYAVSISKVNKITPCRR